MPHRRMNVHEAAEYLHLPVEDVERLVKEEGIPFERQGSRVIFTRKDLDAWASRRILALPEKRLEHYHRGTTARLKRMGAHPRRSGQADDGMVSDLLHPEAIAPALDARTRASVLKETTALAERTGLVNYPRELLEMLRQREELCSTAIPGGAALLHPRHHDPYMFSDNFIALGRTISPVPFGAPDGAATGIFFLICCQDDRVHLHILARLCLLCTRTKLMQRLREAPDATAMRAAVAQSEREAM